MATIMTAARPLCTSSVKVKFLPSIGFRAFSLQRTMFNVPQRRAQSTAVVASLNSGRNIQPQLSSSFVAFHDNLREIV